MALVGRDGKASQGASGWIGELGWLVPLDRHERAVRLAPAILATGPLTVSLVLLAPRAWKLLSGAATSIAVSAAVVILLMQFGRARGRVVQERIVRRHGGLALALAPRDRDLHLPGASKAQHRAALRDRGRAGLAAPPCRSF